jgi:acetyl-CoA carboxylase carboxyl transferase subunit beta
MSWFKKKPNFGFKIRRREAPDGQWIKCDGCGEILYARELERNLRVCSKCDYHFKIGSKAYAAMLADEGTFDTRFDGVVSVDPLGFKDSKRYTDRLKDSRKKTQLEESVLTGVCLLHGHRTALGVMDFAFMGGTLGSATGERVRRLIKLACDERRALVIVSTSGGARMQEGILSLMQMAKTADALADLYERGLPYISILLNPTTAGVAASYAALGDVIISEPKAMIGFAGPRVIQQTINQELPEGFQTAEFVLKHGMIDKIVPRLEMRETVGCLLDMLLVKVREEEPLAETEAADQPATAEQAAEPAAAAAAGDGAPAPAPEVAETPGSDGDGTGKAAATSEARPTAASGPGAPAGEEAPDERPS